MSARRGIPFIAAAIVVLTAGLAFRLKAEATSDEERRNAAAGVPFRLKAEATRDDKRLKAEATSDEERLKAEATSDEERLKAEATPIEEAVDQFPAPAVDTRRKAAPEWIASYREPAARLI